MRAIYCGFGSFANLLNVTCVFMAWAPRSPITAPAVELKLCPLLRKLDLRFDFSPCFKLLLSCCWECYWWCSPSAEVESKWVSSARPPPIRLVRVWVRARSRYCGAYCKLPLTTVLLNYYCVVLAFVDAGKVLLFSTFVAALGLVFPTLRVGFLNVPRRADEAGSFKADGNEVVMRLILAS